ncbi:MAG: hypothetical protein K0V04_36820 [Deltaproteobacteria bacterium]|nr:hypothetical protein [Deltaproteobacteria bacterium]
MLVWAMACVTVSIGAPLEASAGKFDETLDLSLHTRAGSVGPVGVGLAGRGPAVLSDARLVGRALSLTPTFRINLSLSGWRFGVGAGYEGYTGLRLDHDPLPVGYAITDGRVGGIPVEGFVGYAMRSDKRIRPFVEARTTVTAVVARAQLHHRHDGDLGSVRMRAATFGVGGRMGVLLALNDYVFVDVGVGRVFHGPGGWTASVGIGLPIPLSNL